MITAPSKRGTLPMLILATFSVLVACFCFGSNSIIVKLVSKQTTAWAMSFFRFAVGLVFSVIGAALFALKNGGHIRDGFIVKDWRSLVLRSVFGCGQMILFFLGVALTSSGRATLLMCTHPIFAALFGLMLFGERLPKTVFLGVVGGFAGAAIVLWDGSSYSLLGNLVSLIGGACNGMAFHFVRRLRREHSTFIIYLGPCVLGLFLTGFAAPQLLGLSMSTYFLLFAVGAISFFGQIFMTWALRFLPATAGSILGLSEIVFALSLAAAFLNETMPPRFFLGAAVLIASLVLTVLLVNRARRVPA